MALPEATEFQRFDEGMVDIDPDPLLRLASLLPSLEDGLRVAERLRLSNAQRERLRAVLAEGEPLEVDLNAAALRRRLYAWGAAAYIDRVKMAWAADGDERWADLLKAAEDYVRPVLPVGGADAKMAGLAPGPGMGQALKAVEAWWIEQDFKPGRAEVLEKLRALAG